MYMYLAYNTVLQIVHVSCDVEARNVVLDVITALPVADVIFWCGSH